MKYFALFLVLMFLLFAGWQYNDPDPILWIPIYLIAAYAAIQAFRGKSNSEMLIVLFIMSLVGGINSWQQMTAWEGFVTDGLSMKTVNQELARETWGLWICSISYLLFWLMNQSKRTN